MSTTDENGKALGHDPRGRERRRRLHPDRLDGRRNGPVCVAPETRGAAPRVVRDHGFTANRKRARRSGWPTGLVGRHASPSSAAPYFAAILAGATAGVSTSRTPARRPLPDASIDHEREVTLLRPGPMHGATTDGAGS